MSDLRGRKPIIPVTSSWFAKLDETKFCRIGISRGTPRGQPGGYRMYRNLAPGPWFLSCKTPREYMIRYQDEILGILKPERVLEDLQRLAGDRIPALLCFEPPTPGPKWCHRGLVSAWLMDQLGIEVFEVGQEREGAGWEHPKLHPDLRKLSPEREAILFAAGEQKKKAKSKKKSTTRKTSAQGILL
ncbi:MAG: hypothetical protein ACM31O_03835 [Bacteroidota bacterium]